MSDHSRQASDGTGGDAIGNKTHPGGARRGGASGAPAISVVVPVRDESENVGPLVGEIAGALAGYSYEMLFVDDGSVDGTGDRLTELRAAHPELRVLRHAESCGQSAAIRTGVLRAEGAVIVTLDGDGQNDPADIPRLLAALESASPAIAMISGHRRRRHDSPFKKLGSRVANRVRRALLHDKTEDTGCGLKVFRRDVFLRLPYFDHMHRFLPALVKREGYDVGFVDVNHRPRLHGRSHYGNLDRLMVGVTDLAGMIWLRRRCRLPTETTEV